MKGKVKFYNDIKGFGFIKAEDDKEYFVHRSGIEESGILREGDDVEFDVEEGERGPKAVHVKRAEAGEQESTE